MLTSVYTLRAVSVYGRLRGNLAWVPFAGVSVLMLIYYLIDFPRERYLRNVNERLENQLEELNRRSDEAIAVMEDISARDNNFTESSCRPNP